MRSDIPDPASAAPTLPSGAWELPRELELLRRSVADFMAREVRPREEGLDFDAIATIAKAVAPRSRFIVAPIRLKKRGSIEAGEAKSMPNS